MSKFLDKINFLDNKSKFLKITDEDKEINTTATYNPSTKEVK